MTLKVTPQCGENKQDLQTHYIIELSGTVPLKVTPQCSENKQDLQTH